MANTPVSEDLSLDIQGSPSGNIVSPMTCLAQNLSSLSTSGPNTPNRRLSWSNPFPNDGKFSPIFSDHSPSVDSPMFQEGIIDMPKVGNKAKILKAARKIPFSPECENDKENVIPIPKQESKTSEDVFDFGSQDSGYSGGSTERGWKLSRSCSLSSKSSVFLDGGEDGFDNLVEIDNLDDKIPSSLPTNIDSLLTKPLVSKCESKSVLEDLQSNKSILAEFQLFKKLDDNTSESFIRKPLVMKCRSLTSSDLKNALTSNIEFKNPFKRPDSPNRLQRYNKRRRSCTLSNTSEQDNNTPMLLRCYSESAATIMQAVQKSDQDPELIGDCSRTYVLPLVDGRHQDLKSIGPSTLVRILCGKYSQEIQNYTLVDCRYPYEYEAGHIKNAQNIYTKEAVVEKFLSGKPHTGSERNIIIFHCEFSSERAPNLCRFLRNKDREKNESSYPQLHQPEVYLLEGGYKAFFQDFKQYCEPQEYKPMNHKDHGCDLRHFRAKSKSWAGESKFKNKFRSRSKQ